MNKLNFIDYQAFEKPSSDVLDAFYHKKTIGHKISKRKYHFLIYKGVKQANKSLLYEFLSIIFTNKPTFA